MCSMRPFSVSGGPKNRCTEAGEIELGHGFQTGAHGHFSALSGMGMGRMRRRLIDVLRGGAEFPMSSGGFKW